MSNRAGAKMAPSSSTANADTLINLKVNFDGSPSRFKLPLRDLGVSVFEDKLRAYFQIPVDKATTIERYSDSAAAFVTLDPANVAVYKQLYRAAKAKQKLKLRVTTKSLQPLQQTNNVPKAATVEDVPDDELKNAILGLKDEFQELKNKIQKEKEVKQETVQDTPTETADPTPSQSSEATIDTVVAPQTVEEFPTFVKQWRARGMPRIHLRRDANDVEVIDFLGPLTLAAQYPLITREASESSVPYRFHRIASPLIFARLMREASEEEEKDSQAAPEAPMKLSEDFSSPSDKDVAKEESDEPCEAHKRPFSVSCNSCEQYVPNAHFHCSICDDGDFDLCQDCVNRGISCYGEGHWLIKRTIVDGQIKCSSTHISPKSTRSTSSKPVDEQTTPVALGPIRLSLPLRPPPALAHALSSTYTEYTTRTCNCCVQEFREEEFVHCTTCDDFDLCKGCFRKDQHGHHPMHGFIAAVEGSVVDESVLSRLEPGRNCVHNAICDGCDKYIRGVRHKCLDCPDWDYCADCVQDASFVHPNHRFVAIYEALADRPYHSSTRAVHFGICCDGPLCTRESRGKYITGERFKCAVCHDTDFCANCEASPANTHNKTHPLIKFKTPVRHVSVTTTGEHEDGQRLPTMGDRALRSRNQEKSRESTPRETIAATPVQTVVNVQPTEPSAAIVVGPRAPVKQEAVESKSLLPALVQKEIYSHDLCAVFKWDTVKDGSVLPPNHTFEQTWVLRNEGTVPWPAGCSVKFVGGDYMGAVDPAHPAGVRELVCASESTVCYNALNPGQEFPFTVLMRTPDRPGKIISYWRLTTKDGVKFGHKLWCDVNVQAPATTPVAKIEVKNEDVSSPSESRMIIPKLEHESPSASIHENPIELEIETQTETDTIAASLEGEDDFEDCGGQDGWAEESDDGFMTDEEYDILDASDEEYLSEQQKKPFKK